MNETQNQEFLILLGFTLFNPIYKYFLLSEQYKTVKTVKTFKVIYNYFLIKNYLEL